MANYTSSHTGAQIDAAVDKTSKLDGIGYGTCGTAAATLEKTVNISGFGLQQGATVTVTFTYAVPANATLNVTGSGGKPIIYKGAAITANVIKAGYTATFVYNGTNYVMVSSGYDSSVSGTTLVLG